LATAAADRARIGRLLPHRRPVARFRGMARRAIGASFIEVSAHCEALHRRAPKIDSGKWHDDRPPTSMAGIESRKKLRNSSDGLIGGGTRDRLPPARGAIMTCA